MNKLLLVALLCMVGIAGHPKHDRVPNQQVHPQQVPHSIHGVPAQNGQPSFVYPAFSPEEMKETHDMLEKSKRGDSTEVIQDEVDIIDEEEKQNRKERDRAWAYWGFIIGGVAAIWFTIGHVKRSRELNILLQNRRNSMRMPLNPPTQNIHELIAYHQSEIARLQAMSANQQRAANVEWQNAPQYPISQPAQQHYAQVYDVEADHSRQIPVGRPLVQAEMPLRYPQFD